MSFSEAIPLVGSVSDTAEAWGDGQLGLSDFLNPVGVGLEALDVVFNPGEALARSGLGWLTDYLIEHCETFRKIIDCLLGAPDDITATANHYRDFSAMLSYHSEAHVHACNSLSTWNGTAAPAYRRKQQDINAHFHRAAFAANVTQSVIRSAGVLVATVRAFIIAEVQALLAQLITYLATAALTALPTGGWSLAAGTVGIVKTVSTAVARWSLKLAQLVRKMTVLSRQLNVGTRQLEYVHRVLMENASGIRKSLLAGSHIRAGQKVAAATAAVKEGAATAADVVGEVRLKLQPYQDVAENVPMDAAQEFGTRVDQFANDQENYQAGKLE